MVDTAAWPSPWLKGFLEVAVLAIMASGESYGYQICTRLREAGFGEIKGGSLYPILGRLETADLIIGEWHISEKGPGRKYYRLTSAGRQELDARRAAWDQFAAHLNQLFREASDADIRLPQ